MSTKKKVIKYLFSNTISSGINFFSRWFLNYALARLMSLSGFGIYSFIVALANIFKGFISFGGQLYLIYSISSEKENKYLNFFKSSLLSFAITIGLMILLFGIHFFRFKAINSEYFLYAILLASLMALAQNIYSFFKGLGIFSKEAWGYIIILLLTIVFTVLLYFNLLDNSLIVVLITVFILHFALFGYASLQFYKYFKADEIDEDLTKIRNNFGKFIRKRTSYGLHELQSVLYVNATILVLGFVVREEDLAIYKSLQIIIVPFSILPMIFSQVLLKQLTEHIVNNKNIKKLFRVFLVITTLIGAFLFVIFYYFGEQIIYLFYGNKFLNLAYVKEIILLFTIAYFFRFVSANYGVLITARNKQNIRVYATGILILITIFGTIILTKYYGIVGAAYANVISYFTIMFIYVVYSEFKLIK